MEKEIFVTRSSLPPFEEYVDKIQDIWKTHYLTNMGKYHCELEKKLIEYLEVQNLSLFVNGHMALELSLQAMDLGRGEVITTPFTFASTTHAIVRNGLTPVFCDINETDYTLDPEKIVKLITDKTVAILPVHVYGNICDIDAIDKIAKKYNLKVIYDAAHAFSEKYNGIGIGNFGDLSMFSFHATKVFNTIEGGAACFKNKDLASSLYSLKNFGIRSEESVNGIGVNAKMNEFQAAMGICNLNHIEEEIQKRKAVADKYKERLENISGIKLNRVDDKATSNYAYFPIVINEKVFGENRNEIYDRLKRNNIYARKYFYPLTSLYDCYHGRFEADIPIALYISERVLTLPIYSELSFQDIDRICDIVLENNKTKFVKSKYS